MLYGSLLVTYTEGLLEVSFKSLITIKDIVRKFIPVPLCLGYPIPKNRFKLG